MSHRIRFQSNTQIQTKTLMSIYWIEGNWREKRRKLNKPLWIAPSVKYSSTKNSNALESRLCWLKFIQKNGFQCVTISYTFRRNFWDIVICVQLKSIRKNYHFSGHLSCFLILLVHFFAVGGKLKRWFWFVAIHKLENIIYGIMDELFRWIDFDRIWIWWISRQSLFKRNHDKITFPFWQTPIM